MSADELKAKGNAAFQAGDFEEAIDCFTQGIEVNPSNHVLYSNRSASLASLRRFSEALADAKKVVELKADWPKGYSRVGAAYVGLHDWDNAIEAYKKGLELDPSNEPMRASLSEAEQAKASPSSGGALGNMFSSPDFLGKLATNPATLQLLSQPDFMMMMKDCSTNPASLNKYLQDPRFQLALQVGLGMNIMTGDQFSRQQEAEGATVNGAAAKAESAPQEPEPMEEVVEDEVEDEERAARQAKEEALKEKEAGNLAYKQRKFDEAIAHYNRALELYDQDISFLTNRAAVHFEKGDYEACVADSKAAVERGRELRADFKMVARALGRMGSALWKLGKLEDARDAFNKSLTEHRTADVLKKLQDVERAIKDAAESAYVDLALCEKEREAGNEEFRAQHYPQALEHYTEALKRGPPKVNPEAYKLYSNRAACYTKLGAPTEGLRDAEECIKLAPEFVKGYSRKGACQLLLREFDRALETYQKGLELDPENEECKDGVQRSIQALNRFTSGQASEDEMAERREQSMADPDIQRILSDPIMSQVLKDFQENPKAAQEHLRHPEIMVKLRKLATAGIIRLG